MRILFCFFLILNLTIGCIAVAILLVKCCQYTVLSYVSVVILATVAGSDCMQAATKQK